MKANEGSVVKMDMVNRRFHKIFIFLEACKKAFMCTYKPMIHLDAYHLKGAYPSQFMATITLEGNNDFYPLVYGVVKIESKSTLKWLLDLHQDTMEISK